MWHFCKGFSIILYLLLACEWNVAATRCKYKNNCTCLERELEKDLREDSPPHWKNDTFFSNAHNISRALYPPDLSPAKVINVEVTLYNSGTNCMRKINYVWAISSIYTILPPLVLSFVSLGTLYHTSTKLELSVREFCLDVPGDTYLKNAIFSLEDLSITPKASDARLNTAKYVFQEEEENETFRLSIAVLVLQIIFSICGGYCITFYWVEQDDNLDTCAKTGVHFTAIFLLALYCLSVFIFGLVVGLCVGPQTGNPVYLYILTAHSVSLVVFLFFKIADKKIKKSECYFYPFSYVVCFHFSWVSLGVFSNPLWALPVLLTILTTILLIFCGAYYHNLLQANADPSLKVLYGMFVVTFSTYVAFTWISARSFFTNQLISSLIQALLTAGLGLTAPIWGRKKQNEAAQPLLTNTGENTATTSM